MERRHPLRDASGNRARGSVRSRDEPSQRDRSRSPRKASSSAQEPFKAKPIKSNKKPKTSHRRSIEEDRQNALKELALEEERLNTASASSNYNDSAIADEISDKELLSSQFATPTTSGTTVVPKTPTQIIPSVIQTRYRPTSRLISGPDHVSQTQYRDHVSPTQHKKTQPTEQVDYLRQIIEKQEEILAVVQKQEHQISKLEKVIEEQTQAIRALTTELKDKHSSATVTETSASKATAVITAPASQRSFAQVASSTVTPVAQPTQRKPADKPHFAVDLSKCNTKLSERTTAEIRQHFTSALQAQSTTKDIIFRMTKDIKRDHKYYLFFSSESDAHKARIYNNWVLLQFPRARIHAPETYTVKVNGVQAQAVLNSFTKSPCPIKKQKIMDENAIQIVRIRWLSGRRLDARYGSMAIELTSREQANSLLSEGFLTVGGEDAHVKAFLPQEQVTRRCFNYQGFGHHAHECKKTSVCGNCADKGHSHRDCTNPWIQCTGCNGEHRAKDINYPAYQVAKEAAQAAKNKDIDRDVTITPAEEGSTAPTNPEHGW